MGARRIIIRTALHNQHLKSHGSLVKAQALESNLANPSLIPDGTDMDQGA